MQPNLYHLLKRGLSNLFGKPCDLCKGGSEEQRHRKSHLGKNNNSSLKKKMIYCLDYMKLKLETHRIVPQAPKVNQFDVEAFNKAAETLLDELEKDLKAKSQTTKPTTKIDNKDIESWDFN